MTRCDVRVQILVIDVLKLIIEAMRENFNKISQGKVFRSQCRVFRGTVA